MRLESEEVPLTVSDSRCRSSAAADGIPMAAIIVLVIDCVSARCTCAKAHKMKAARLG